MHSGGCRPERFGRFGIDGITANQAGKFLPAVVVLDGDNHEGPHCIRNSFTQGARAVISVNLDLATLLERATTLEASL